ncbi:hypothetical protein B0A55_02713 [Friedmanniomyces simplex]|uniref:Uncharacterized protein n=1 Tax=Friedmanniomyces simplex TaxID=329884 RepID=A0A4U0XNH4_9PEZI|nr:hypothetical protein B0A55_02713 [Friedmanniomyces simplex]
MNISTITQLRGMDNIGRDHQGDTASDDLVTDDSNPEQGIESVAVESVGNMSSAVSQMRAQTSDSAQEEAADATPSEGSEVDSATGEWYDPEPMQSEGREYRPPREAREKYVDNPITRSKRDEFREPLKFQRPHPYDLIFSHAHSILKKYNDQLAEATTDPIQSFAYKSDPLRIEALSISPTMFYSGGCDSTAAVHCLVRHDLFIKVQLKLVCDLETGWSSATVMVRDDDRWISLSKFLSTLETSSLSTVGRCGYKLQYLWWRSMKKSSDDAISAGQSRQLAVTATPLGVLGKLPLEIRRLLLLHCIGERVAPQKEDRLNANGQYRYVTVLTRGGNFQQMNKSVYDCTGPPLVRRTNESLLCLNSTTSALALQILNEDTIKVYPAPRHLDHSQANFHFLRHLQLCFTNREYIDFFRVDLPPFNAQFGWTANAGADILNDLPLLSELEIFFRPPTSRKASPWEPDSKLSYEPALFAGYSGFPCQKVLVDWILCFAADYVKKIPRVKLTGYIKTITKKKWESLLGGRNSAAGVAAVIDEQKKEIRGLRESDLPPACFCPTPCEYDAINDADDARTEADRTLRGFDALKYSPKPWVVKPLYREYQFDFDDEGLGRVGREKFLRGFIVDGSI